MSGEGTTGREERAAEALIVNALRQEDEQPDRIDPKCLPDLDEAEKAALSALGTDFIGTLLAGSVSRKPRRPKSDPPATEMAGAGGGAHYGLNRTDEPDPEAAAEVERQRQAIIERKRREQADGQGEGGR